MKSKKVFVRTKDNPNSFSLHQEINDDDKINNLEKGYYDVSIYYGMFGRSCSFKKIEFEKNLVKITEEPFLSTARKIVKFFSDETKTVYSDLKIKHKMGALLYGPPGTGKTSYINMILETLVNTYGCIVLRLNSSFSLGECKDIVDDIRSNNNNIPVVLFADEMETFEWNNNFLEFLDGYDSLDGTCVIGATNYLNSLSPKLTQRASRFIIKQEINFLPESVIIQIINKTLPEKYLSKLNIEEILTKLKGKSITIDNLKNILTSMFTQNMNLDESLEFILENKVIKYDYEK